jgi:hypothetical protein
MKIPSWLIPAILLIVSIDLWVSATGEADPYKLTRFPFTDIAIIPAFSIASMARGIGIVLAVTYGIDALRFLLTSNIVWMKKIGYLLLVLVSLMLLVETSVITPFIVTSMADTGIAKTLRTVNLFGYATGNAVYFGWALMVAIMPLLGVVISAIATIASNAKELQGRIAAPKKIEKPKVEPAVTTPEIQPEQIAKADKPLSRPEQLKLERGIK